MVASNMAQQCNKELSLIQKLEILEQFFGISSIKFQKSKKGRKINKRKQVDTLLRNHNIINGDEHQKLN